MTDIAQTKSGGNTAAKSALTRRSFIKAAGLAGAGAIAGAAGFGLAGCGGQTTVADTVVYGKIYTSNSNGKYAEALAVKDGKYIYVGDKEGAKAYVKDGTTTVVNRENQGLVMAGATEGHGHYILAATMEYKGFMVSAATQDEIATALKEQVSANPDAKLYFLYGWDNQALLEVKETLDMRAALDAVCSDKIVVMMDNTGHNCFMNSKAIEAAGFDANTKIEGGVISKDASGRLLGLASDIATNYVIKNVIAKQSFMTTDDFTGSIQVAEQRLHSYGYTNYFDGYTSYFGESAYKGISETDNGRGIKLNVGASYKIDPFDDTDSALAEAVDEQGKYATTHFKPNWIKLFTDGECVESLSGWVLTPYKDGSTGTQVWNTDTFNALVKKANEKGLGVHAHASGDAATKQATDAFVAAESSAKDGVLNCLAHCRQITDETMDAMAKHNIYSATNICWRTTLTSRNDFVDANFERSFYESGYPMESQVKRGIKMTSSTDYPSNSGAPCDVCSIIELAVNGTLDSATLAKDQYFTWAPEEFLSVEEALDVMTINGAYQLGVESERGSIETGKYADFICIDKDITSVDKDKIHEGKVVSVYFEGKEVYTG
jgi:predicted amidohydrolase YtcJ